VDNSHLRIGPESPIIGVQLLDCKRAVAIAILGGYAGLYVLYSISSAIGGGSKKKAPVAAVAASTTESSAGTIPPIDSPEFEKFLESDALIKLLESDELLTAALEKA
jgi:hypothetical protein